MLLMSIMGLLAQTGEALPEAVETTELASGNHSIFSLIIHANGVVQLTLLLLVGFSIVSWAIIGAKHKQLKATKKLSDKFYDHFLQAQTIEGLVNKGAFRKSPALNIFKAAVEKLRNHHDRADAILIEREIRRATEDEIEQMEYGVPFLATTGSAAPFIGLFGTVWGILNAFWKIGKTGATSLAIVGPHIAEALIATAIGLAAAIPAVIFYNIYVQRIRLLSKDLQDFSDDLVTRINREYFNARS